MAGDGIAAYFCGVCVEAAALNAAGDCLVVYGDSAVHDGANGQPVMPTTQTDFGLPKRPAKFLLDLRKALCVFDYDAGAECSSHKQNNKPGR